MQKFMISKASHIQVCKASMMPYLAFFLSASVIGWLWEVLVYYANNIGKCHLMELLLFYRGVLHGPWTPIYGVGAVLMVFLYRNVVRTPGKYFLTCIGVCAVLEYVTSWMLEMLFQAKWWDYTGYFLNVNGRICAMSLLFFGVAGMVIACCVAPAFWKWIQKCPKSLIAVVCGGITIIFLLDVLLSCFAPNVGIGVQIMP